MTLPTLVFGGLIATLYGAIFHLVRGGGIGRMIVYIILSWAGFWSGHLLAERLNWDFLNIGTLHLGIATVSSFVIMILGHWVFLGRNSPKN
jgi:hypothetical protein